MLKYPNLKNGNMMEMEAANEKKQEVILELYSTQIDELFKKITFHYFENTKPYSFDYQYKSEFDEIISKLQKELEQKKLSLSPTISNKLPIFLPSQTSRIAFFSYKSKSVRPIDTKDLEAILTKQADKQCRSGELPSSEIGKLVKEDLSTFKAYHKEHDFNAYRRDISTSTIQFNAYDKDDNLLIEKSFVRGGLIFDMKKEDFLEKIDISYPRYRKQRSDKKSEYLPLKLMKIRGIVLPSA